MILSVQKLPCLDVKITGRVKLSFSKRILLLPILASLGVPASAYSACNVTAGTLTTPDNASTVTCSGTVADTAIGDSATNATVVLQASTIINRAEDEAFISLNDAVVTLGSSAQINMNNKSAIQSVENIDLTMENNSKIDVAGANFKGAIYAGGTVSLEAIESKITITSDGLFGAAIRAEDEVTLNLTSSDGSIISGGKYAINSEEGGITLTGSPTNLTLEGAETAIRANESISLTIGSGAKITGYTKYGIYSYYNSVTVNGSPGSLTISGKESGINAYQNISLTLGNTVTITGTDRYGMGAIKGTVTLEGNPDELTISGYSDGINARSHITLALGDDNTITGTENNGIFSFGGAVNITGNPNDLTITGHDGGISGTGDMGLAFGDRVTIEGTEGMGIFHAGKITLTGNSEDLKVIGGTTGIRGTNQVSLALGDGAIITGGATNAIISTAGNVIINGNPGELEITGGTTAIQARTSVSLTLGNEVTITGTATYGITSQTDIITILGNADDVSVTGGVSALKASKAVSLTLGADASFTGGTGHAIESTTAGVTITGEDVSGLTILGGGSGIKASTDVALTLGADASIKGVAGQGVWADNGTLTIAGNPRQLEVTAAISALTASANIILALGNNTTFTGTTKYGIYSDVSEITITGTPEDLTVLGGEDGMKAGGLINLALGNNASITGTNGDGIVSQFTWVGISGGADDLEIMGGDNGIQSAASVSLVVDDNASITGTTGYGIVGTGAMFITAGDFFSVTGYEGGLKGSTITMTLGAGAIITTTKGYAIEHARDVVIGAGSSITTADETAILGTTAADVIHLSGTIKGAVNALDLAGGDDELILATGTSITGDMIGGDGTDSIILQGTGSITDEVTGFETLEMEGANWTLAGNVSVTNFAHESGNLHINGTLTSNLAIATGATLNGIGTIIGNVTNDGIVAPGNSIGTQAITGNFVQTKNGALTIELNETQNDLLQITGKATLDGTLNLVVLDDAIITKGRHFTFLTATEGIAGTFAEINDPYFDLDGALTTDGTEGEITFVASSLAATAGAVPTEQRLFDLINEEEALSDVQDLLANLSDESAADLLASQTGFVTRSASIMGVQALRQTADMVLGRGGNSNSAVQGHSTGVSSGDETAESVSWAQANIVTGEVDGDYAHRSIDYHLWGAVFGIEKQWDDDWGGLFAGLGLSKTQPSHAAVNESDGETGIYQLGIYRGRAYDQWRIKGMVSAALLDTNSKRTTPEGIAQSHFMGYSALSQLRVEYETLLNDWNLTPFAQMDGALVTQRAAKETGAGILNMEFEGDTSFYSMASLGLDVGRVFTYQEWIMNPKISVGWEQELNDPNDQTNAQFITYPTQNFAVDAIQKSENAFLVGAEMGLGSQLSDLMHFYVDYDGRFATKEADHAFQLGVKLAY